jgi:hypothetical protein
MMSEFEKAWSAQRTMLACSPSIHRRTTVTQLRALMVCLLAVLVLAGAPASIAQEAFTDAKVQSFASAAVAVNAIFERWRPQIEAASSEADRQQMAQKAQGEMRAAVEGTEGLSVEEYQAIAQAAQGDPQLMARIDKAFKEIAPAPQ